MQRFKHSLFEPAGVVKKSLICRSDDDSVMEKGQLKL